MGNHGLCEERSFPVCYSHRLPGSSHYHLGVWPPNQTDAFLPTSTFPIILASGAIQALLSILGVSALNLKTAIIGPRIHYSNRERTLQSLVAGIDAAFQRLLLFLISLLFDLYHRLQQHSRTQAND